MKPFHSFRAILPLAFFALSASLADAQVVYSDVFPSGAGGSLNGTPLDVGTGTWTAANVVTADGAFATGPGSATLPFVPSNGERYTLDARVTGVTGDENWVALGFANGQSTGTTASERFITGNATTPGVVGTTWMLFRGDNGTYNNVAFNATGALGVGNGGTVDGADWSAFSFQNGTTPGSIDLRIVLDTTGGSGAWKVTSLAKARPCLLQRADPLGSGLHDHARSGIHLGTGLRRFPI